MPPSHVAVFSTCPQSRAEPREGYAERIAEVARWSEAAGCEGMLVYADNGLVDPWLVAAQILQATKRLAPLVAVQPAYMHPYSTAKLVASLGYLFERRVYLNFVAGGFRNDLVALDDATPHDERYDRATEYAVIVKRLLDGETLSLAGRYYSVNNLRMTPELAPELRPGMLISGSSEAGLAAAEQIGATPVKYPERPSEEPSQKGEDAGIRVGIVTRPDAAEAWRVARARFPEDRKGQLAHKLAMKVSDSHWHRQLSDMSASITEDDEDPYWLWPFQNYATFCPYLVGSYARVAAELTRYMELGFRVFILDIPGSEEELSHTGNAFDEARAALSS